MSSFNQGVPGPATLINSSNCIVLGNTSSGTALTVQQLGAGAVMNVATSSGSSALFVSSTGLVGVGTTSPANGFYGSGLIVNSGTINGSNAFNMVLLSNATTVNYTQVGQIGFGIGGDMPSFSIQSQAVNRDNGAGPYYDYGAQSDLRFLYKSVNIWPYGGVNEAMRIKGTNGYVGIGVTNPSLPLDVLGGVKVNNSNQTTALSIQPDGSDYYGSIIGKSITWDGTYYNIYSDGANRGGAAIQMQWRNIAFYTYGGVASATTAQLTPTQFNAYQRMTITAAGNVGINVTNPGAQLQIGGTGVTGNVLQIGNFTFQMVSYQGLFGAGTVTYTPSGSGIFVAYFACDTMVFTSTYTPSGQYSAVTTYLNSATLTGNGGLGQLSLSTAVNGVLTATFKGSGDYMRVFRMAF